jgi:hypothetical protein
MRPFKEYIHYSKSIKRKCYRHVNTVWLEGIFWNQGPLITVNLAACLQVV